MASNWRLNDLQNAPRLDGLFEAIPRRYSCRSFSAAPTAEQWSTLMTACDELALPDVRIALGMCETKLFQPLMGLLMKFENVQRFAAIIATDARPESIVNAGASGELFLLRGVQSGLEGCWVTGTYRRGLVGLKLAENEKLLGLIALGIPKEPAVLPIARNRKPPEALCPEIDSLHPAFREVLQYVRVAPSAMNMQPWRISVEGEKRLSIAVPSGAHRLDLGIGVSHALLALGSTPATFSLSEDGLRAVIELS